MKAIKKFLKELHTVTGNVEKYGHNTEYWTFLKGLRSEATNDITLLNEQQKTQILNRINDISQRLDRAAPIIRSHHKKARENQFSFDEFSEQVYWLTTGTPGPPKKDLIHYLSCWHNAITKKKAELKLFVAEVKKVFPEAKLIKPENKTPLKVIALKYVYEGNQITRENGSKIAENYGWRSGDKLFNHYSHFSSRANRTGYPGSLKRLKNKIELFENTIKLLDKRHSQRAIDEVNILKNIYDNEKL